jgi:hypothetical protein
LTFSLISRSTVKTAAILIIALTTSCEKIKEISTKTKAPLRTYFITARLDNKQAGTDSKASALLKGIYSEKTKQLSYTITYKGIEPTSIRIEKGRKGSRGTFVAELSPPDNETYLSPLKGEKKLTSLQERDLLKGLWYISVVSANYQPYEIRGMVTPKLR